MNVFLKVFRKNQSLGTLQMVYEKWKGGQISQNWEWIGGNGTDDGGTWKWAKDDLGKVCIYLDSNVYKLIVATLYAERWNDGVFPPHTPWFVAASPYEWDNYLDYYGTKQNMYITANWLPK